MTNLDSSAFHMMYSAYKLNKQGDSIQPDVLLSSLIQSIVPCPTLNCCFLTCMQISQEVGEVIWYSHLFKNFPQFVESHIVKGFSLLSEAKVDVFLELSCFFYDPVDVGNLFSGSSSFSKSSLYIWKFLVHLLLKPSLKDLSITSLACEMSAIVW